MFFRREICVTRDMQQADRIRSLLLEHGIKSSVAVPSMIRGTHSYHGAPGINSSVMYEYHISVKSKDAEEALEVLKLL